MKACLMFKGDRKIHSAIRLRRAPFPNQISTSPAKILLGNTIIPFSCLPPIPKFLQPFDLDLNVQVLRPAAPNLIRASSMSLESASIIRSLLYFEALTHPSASQYPNPHIRSDDNLRKRCTMNLLWLVKDLRTTDLP